MSPLRLTVTLMCVAVGVLAVFFVGVLTGEAIHQPTTTEDRPSEFDFQLLTFKDIEISDSLIVRERRRLKFGPVEKKWIHRDNVPGADSTVAERVLLVFYDTIGIEIDTVTYENR